MNLVARGVPETFAVFLLPVQKGLGVSRADITLTYSVYMVAFGLSGPFAGQLIDRLGARVAYGFGLASLGVGYLLAGFATELWHYLLTVGLLGGLGAAALGMIVASALLSRWFDGHRLDHVVAVRGDRCRHAAIAATHSGADLALRLAGGTHGAGSLRAADPAAGHAAAARAHGRWIAGVARDAHRHRRQRDRPLAHRNGATHERFLGAVCRISFTAVASFSVLPHSVAYLIEHGFEPLVAAGAFGFAGMLSAIGIVAVGWLSDRFGRRQTATLSYISTIVGIAALTLVSFSPTLALVYAFVFFPGLMQGARGPIIVAMVAVLFPGGVGAIYGTLSVAQRLGAGLGSWASGPSL